MTAPRRRGLIFLPPGEPGVSAPTPMLKPSGVAPAAGAGEPKRAPLAEGAPNANVEPGAVLDAPKVGAAGVELAPNWNGALVELTALVGAPKWKPVDEPVGVDPPEAAPKAKDGAEAEPGLELVPAFAGLDPKLKLPDAGAEAPKPVDGAGFEPKPVPGAGVLPNPPVAGTAEALPKENVGLLAELPVEPDAEAKPEPVPKPAVGDITPKPVLPVVVVGEITGPPKLAGAGVFLFEPKSADAVGVFEPKLNPADGAGALPKLNCFAASPFVLVTPKLELAAGEEVLPNEKVEGGAADESVFASPPKEKPVLPDVPVLPKPGPGPGAGAGVDEAALNEKAGLSPLAVAAGAGADGVPKENGLAASAGLSVGTGFEPPEPKEKGTLFSAGLSAAGAAGAPNDIGALASSAGLSSGAPEGVPKLN